MPPSSVNSVYTSSAFAVAVNIGVTSSGHLTLVGNVIVRTVAPCTNLKTQTYAFPAGGTLLNVIVKFAVSVRLNTLPNEQSAVYVVLGDAVTTAFEAAEPVNPISP
jgi:hypothetical protein